MKRLWPLLLLSACNVFEPPEGWTELRPPAQYRIWHAEVQTCISEKRSFDKIIWREVHATKFLCGDSTNAIGCMVFPNTIYLAQLSLNSAFVVKGELIHYIRQSSPHDSLHMSCQQ